MLQALSDFISKVTRGEKLTIGGVEAQWKKVAELTPGMMIAVPAADVALSSDSRSPRPDDTDVMWDEIVSIRRLSPERVYDIEVEGTHNFVAGHMIETPMPKTVAHLSDESPRGPPRKETVNCKLKIENSTSKWYGGIFAHNTYISGNLGIGTTSPGSKLQVVGNITPSATSTYDLGSSSLYWNNVYANNLLSSGQYGGFWQRNSGVLSPINITDDLFVGTTATPSSATSNYFQVLGSGSTAGDSSSSGSLVLGTNRTSPTISTRSFKDLTLGDSQTGNIILSPGTGKQVQFFSSSNSINSSGNLVIAGTTTFGGIAYTWPSSGQSAGYALTTNGSGALSWAAASGLGTNYWTLANGSLYPVNATVDLLVGGSATTSAKFAFINVASGTPTASVSGNLTLDAAGVIATTKMQQLTLGSATTGPIQLSPKGTTGLFVDATGQVGIGTTNPGVKLDINTGAVVNSSAVRITGGDLTIADRGDTFGSQITLNGAGYANRWDIYNEKVSGKFRLLSVGGSVETIAATSNGNVGIGTTAPISRTQITNNPSTLTGKSALIIDQYEGEDLFTASASGTTRLKLTNAGNLTFNQASTISTAGSANLTLDAGGNLVLADTTVQLSGGSSTLDVYNASADTTLTLSNTGGSYVANLSVEGQVQPGSYAVNPTAIGNGAIIYRSDQTQLYYYNGSAWTAIGSGSGGGSLWRIIAGMLSPLNDTLDVSIGGSATSSAKFAFLNVNTGTPTASVSAGAAGATYLTADGVIATTAKQSLTLGNSTTGNIILNGGNVGIGTTNPNVRLGELLDISVSANYGGMTLKSWSTTAAHGSILDFDRSGSTTIGTQAIVSSGNNLGYISFRGSDGTAFQGAAQIRGVVDGTPGTSDMPGRLEFYTTPDGSASLAERMRIDNAGLVGIGTTAPISRTQITNNPSTLTGKAALLVDQYENQDLMTASASGTTRFYVTNSGDMVAQRFADLANTSYLVDPAATGNAAVNIAGGVTTGTGILTSTVANGSTAVGFTLNTSNTLSTQGSKLLSVKNNSTEKFYIDSSGNLYVAGTVTSSKGLSTLLTNKSGASVAVGDLVVVDTTTASSFTTTTVAHSKKAFGVIVGIGLGVTNDADGDGVCDANDICLIATQGKVTVTGSNTTTIGDYMYSSTTAGKALASSVQSDGLIGIAMSADASDPYSVEMMFVVQPSGGGGGFFSNSNASVADGSYVEVAHNQATNDLNTTSWQYNTNTSQYEQIDANSAEQATASATVNFNTEGNYTQENMAYSVTLTPSATSGDITLTLGSGTWSSDARVQNYCEVSGNGGVATLTAAPAAQTTITATTTTAFTNTSAIASGSWYLYCTSYTGGVATLNNNYNSNAGSFSTASQGQLTTGGTSSGVTLTASVGGTRYLYFIGGRTGAGSFSSTVQKASIDASNNVGTWATTSQAQLPTTLGYLNGAVATIGGTSYMYIIGGWPSGSAVSTVYKATIDTSGNVGAFSTTSQGQLPAVRYLHPVSTVTIGGTNYIYVVGGSDGSVYVSTVYKATIDTSGNVGTFSTTSQSQLPMILGAGDSTITTVGGTSYLYVLGGYSPSSYRSIVYKATIDSSGNIGTFATTSQAQLPGVRENNRTGIATVGGTQYLYSIGGDDGAVNYSTVYKASINSTGDLGTFSTTGQAQLPQVLAAGGAIITTVSGTNYIYTTDGAGYNSTVVYKSTIGPDNNPITTVYSVATAGDQISTSSWGDIDDVDVTETLNSQTIYYAVSFDGRTTFATYDSTTNNNGWRPIARNNSGTWQYNSNTSAGVDKVTWTNATYNSQNGALSQAFGVTQNQMSGTTMGALTDGNWNEINGYTTTTATLDFAAGFKSSSSTQNPQVDQITVDYTKAGFKVIQTDTNTARLYNYSGSTKNLRLDVTTNGGAVHSGLYTNSNASLANGSYVEVAHNQNTNSLLTNGWVNLNGQWKDISTATESGIISTTNASVANGSYVEVVHNQQTNDPLANGWFYNTGTSKWENINNATTATGGTITQSSGNTIHTFTSSGTFTPTFSMTTEILVVAGGGGGGAAYSAGGGGAGGVINNTSYAVTPQAYTVTVGAGGAGSTTQGVNGSNGSNSVFNDQTATGGGGGGGSNVAGSNGGSGGGGGGNDTSSRAGGSGSGSQGSAGGANYVAYWYSGGGGGGKGAVGTAGSASSGGAGGAGTAYTTSGSSVTYAGGGGGAFFASQGAGGSGGSGGGGRGTGSAGACAAGTANTGGGGGGGGDAGNGCGGGSGVVIVKYSSSTAASLFKIVQQDANTVRLYNYSGSAQNLRLDVSTQAFQIRQIDTNTVRLYNYSGATQNLRLDTIVGGVDSPSNGTVTLAPTSADVDTQNSTNSIWVNKTGLDGTLLKLQKSGSDIFNLSQAGGNAALVLDQRLSGDIFTASASGTSKLVLTNGGNLGLGTTSPNSKLHAVTDDAVIGDGTGGTITYSGGYTIHTFTSGGTFTPPTGLDAVEYLVVGGGGGGGGQAGGGVGRGGGGAGGFRTGTVNVSSQGYSVTVGAGGAGGVGAADGSNGSNSVFSTITSTGGGGGAGLTNGTPGNPGGSGGGGMYSGAAGGAGTTNQGNNGGAGTTSATNYGAGGGGGASAVGAAGTATTGGNGGAGTASSITGTSVTYAGGGGGGTYNGGTPGSGGAGGGGAGATGATATSGTANTGGGGGGSGGNTAGNGGSGGSGIVVIRYPTSSTDITDILTLDHTTTGTALNGIGTGILFRTEDSGGNTENAGRISGILANATNGSEQSALTFDTRGVNYVSDVGTFATTSQGQLPANNGDGASVTASIGGTQYVYVIGGQFVSTVYKATIDSSANIGTFATTSQAQLLQTLNGNGAITTSIGGTQYLYVVGGQNGSGGPYRSTVYKATIDTSGNVGTFATTSQGQLPAGFGYHSMVNATIGGTQYIYVIGGYTNSGPTIYSTVYKATIDTSGNVGAFATTSQGQLLQTLYGTGAAFATIGGTNYLYVNGGYNGSAYVSTVYRATVDSSGNVGTFATTSQAQMPTTVNYHRLATISIGGTQYLYSIGGANAGNFSTVYKAAIDSSGNVGTFATTSQGQLPQTLYLPGVVNSNVGGTQYLYVLGGNNANVSTVYKATIGPDTGSATLTRRMKLDHVGNLTISGTITQSGSPDIAENVRVSDSSIGGGDVVAIDSNQESGIMNQGENDIYNRFIAKKADVPYSKQILGVISTDPGIVLNASKNVVNDDKRSAENERPLVLAGRVPVKIDPDSEPIEVGDALTASTKPGLAQKATKAGYIIAKALESWTSCAHHVPSSGADQGCGAPSILAMVQYGYQTGDLSPKEFFSLKTHQKTPLSGAIGDLTQEESNLTCYPGSSVPGCETNVKSVEVAGFAPAGSWIASQILHSSTPTPTTIIASASALLKEHWDSFSKTNTDLIQSLWVKTGVLTADLIESRMGLISPIGQIGELQTNIISPLASDSAGIAVRLGPTQTFGIYNKEGSPAATFDSQGNATFSGTLYADRIVTRFGDIENLKVSTVAATYITNNITNNVNASPSALPDATSSALLALLSQEKSVPLDSLKITTNLSVLGTTTLGSTSVAGTLLVDGSLSLNAYGINTIGETLYLQKQKLANFDVMDGSLVVNTLGNVTVKGDLTVGGTLFTNTISPLADGDFILNLSHATPSAGFAKFVIRGSGGLAVATIDASGSASFAGDVVASGSGIFSKLVIASGAKQSLGIATGSATPRDDTSIGTTTLPAGTTQVDISTTKVTDNSYIYITPISSTNNQVLYLKSKTAGSGFTVSVDQPLPQDVQFNWWIIN